MSFSVRLTKCWRETTTKRERQTRQIEHQSRFCTLQVLPICRLSHDTQFHYQISWHLVQRRRPVAQLLTYSYGRSHPHPGAQRRRCSPV